MNFQLLKSRSTFKYAKMYQEAREEGHHLLAFYALFHLQVDDSCEEEGSEFQLYMDNKTTCAVCLAAIPKKNGALTECFHLFCRVCLDQWMQQNRTCPIYRQHVCKYRLPVKSDSWKRKGCRDLGCPDGMSALGCENLHEQFKAAVPVLRHGWRPPPKRFFPEPPSNGSFQNPPLFPKQSAKLCVWIYVWMNEWMNEGMNSWPKPIRRVIFKSPVKKRRRNQVFRCFNVT